MHVHTFPCTQPYFGGNLLQNALNKTVAIQTVGNNNNSIIFSKALEEFCGKLKSSRAMVFNGGFGILVLQFILHRGGTISFFFLWIVNVFMCIHKMAALTPISYLRFFFVLYFVHRFVTYMHINSMSIQFVVAFYAFSLQTFWPKKRRTSTNSDKNGTWRIIKA